MIVVSDTSPLRALQAIDRVALAEQVYGRVLVPPAVVAELGLATATVPPFNVSDFPFLVVQPPTDSGIVIQLLTELNRGESEALALAVEIHAGRVLVDESDARRVARRLGLNTIGVMGLLVRGKRLGFVDRIGPLMDALDARISFRLSAKVRRQILADAGE